MSLLRPSPPPAQDRHTGGGGTAARCRTAVGCLVIAAMLCLLAPADAQQSPGAAGIKVYPLSTMGISGTPTRMFFDKSGQLWVGGNDGLACFDGKTFRTYTAEDGLAGNFITDIEADPSGMVYVATQHGISRYTGRAGRPFEPLAGMEGLVFITCILPLSHDTLLLGDIGHNGLHKWVKGEIDEPYPNIAVREIVTDLCRDGSGAIYLAQPEHLFILRGSGMDSFSIAANAKTWATVVPGTAGTVWCVAGKLYQAGPKGITDSLVPPTSDASILNRLVAVPDGRLITVSDDLLQYNPDSRRWDTLASQRSLGGPVAFALSRDSQMVWICGQFGLARIYTPPALARVPPVPGCFITNKDGIPVAANCADRMADHTFITSQIPAAAIRRVYRDRRGQMWYLTSAGLYWREGSTLKHYSPPYEDAKQGVVFNTALEDGAGNVWFGTSRGMLRYDGRQFFISLPIEKNVQEHVNGYMPTVNTISLVRGKGGRILGGCHELIYIASPDMHIRESKNFGGSGSISCTGFARSGAGDIWAVMDGRLRGITDHTDTGGDLEPTDSLPVLHTGNIPASPKNIAFDGNDNLWVTSQRILYVYLRQPGARPYSPSRVYLFTANDLPGLLTGNVDETIQRDTAGNILVGHGGQSYRLNAGELIADAAHAQPPLLSFSGLLLNGRPADWPAAAPRFPDSVRSLNFHFTATTPLNAEYISYAYRLAGYSNEWSSSGTSGELSFSGLPAGRYNLEVRATDINGRQSGIVAFPFTILPPWYRTAWAWALWIALVAGAIWGLFQLRLRAVRRKARVERLVVEHELKALRAQINPHFLQNTFAFLVHTLEEQPVSYSVEVINLLSAYLRNVLYRSDAPVVNMEDELAFAEEYLAMNRLLLEDAFTYKTEVEDGLDTYNIRLPSMLLQPLLENAIKHGRAASGGRPAEIKVSVYADGQSVYCAISNPVASGTGKSPLPGYLPKGLEITKQRLGLLYKGADITAGEDAGIYKVILRLPLLHYKEAALPSASADRQN